MCRFLLLFASFVACCTLHTARAAIHTVTNTDDSGPGSLRAAITSANGAFGPDEIEFTIPGTGVRTINVLTPLPPILQRLTIDGYTQPGSLPNTQPVGNNANILIEIRGNSAPSGVNGLTAATGVVTIRGLAIGGFKGNGIVLQSGGGSLIEGCFIGTNPDGATLNANSGGIYLQDSAANTIGGATPGGRNVIVGDVNPAIYQANATGNSNVIRGNYIGVNAAGTQVLGTGGILLLSSNNLIGSTSAESRNVISCVGRYGIELSGAAATFNNIVGNYIGLTADGATPLFQDQSGVYIGGASNNRVGGSDEDDGSADGIVASRNVIVAKSAGIVVAGGIETASTNVIRGNFIGTLANGSQPSGELNSGAAVLLVDATNNVIGGDVAGAGNVLANYEAGILIFGSRPSSGGNSVQGNFIGTNAANDPFLGNFRAGVLIAPPSTNNVIGGDSPARGNVIGRCGVGLEITADDNFIRGNYIGISRDGSAIPNVGSGVLVSGSGNRIGGGVGEGNRIARNGEDGVTVRSGGRRNAIVANSIYENGTGAGGIGIDLTVGDSASGDGLTANDAGDVDNGANDLQNHPVLTFARQSGAMLTVAGRLESKPSSTYRIEFFRTINRPRLSQGEIFFGSQLVNTDAAGRADFEVTFLSSSTLPQVISATAVDSEGNTSEFGGLPDKLLNIATRLPVLTGDNALIGGFIVTGTENKRVLLRAIGPSLSSFGSAALQDPTLDLFQGNTLLVSNDNWRDTQPTEIAATGIPPTAEAESAIVRELAPGLYTAIVRGKNNTTGIGLVEAYDLGQGTDARLANISTRGFVQTGDNIMIGGFIVGGESGRGTRVLVRGIGPSLTGAAVPNPLQDPTLDLVDGSGTILATNNNWRDTQESEIQSTGAAPTNNNEAAIVAPLGPGGYTALLRGNGGGTGVGLVEIYKLD